MAARDKTFRLYLEDGLPVIAQEKWSNEPHWLPIARVLETACSDAGMPVKRTNRHWRPTGKGPFPESLLMACIRRANGALSQFGAEIIRAGSIVEPEPEAEAGAPPEAVILDTMRALTEEQEHILRLKGVVGEKRNDLEQAQGELDYALKQQGERADWLAIHNPGSSDDWRAEAGLV